MHHTRILIVDDDPDVISLIQSLLGKPTNLAAR